MNESSPMLLVGVGTAGTAIARGIHRAFGEGLRYVLLDTDATSARDDDHFLLLGGDRLSGRGAGGDIVNARIAAEDSIDIIDNSLIGVRLAVIVTALGGGTGGGATLELTKHFAAHDIPCVVFATTPFAFEGEARHQNARGILTLIEEQANASFFIPLDKLIGETDQMDDALRRGVDTLASAVTLFWRLVEKPGYIRLDTERIRHFISHARHGRFATVTVQGPNRAAEAIDALTRAPLLAHGNHPIDKMLCGVLAGEDLRLSEIAHLAKALQTSFGKNVQFELATVNDEMTFAGRLSVVVLLLEKTGKEQAVVESTAPATPAAKKPRADRNPLARGPRGRGRFNNSERTMINGVDLDLPTYFREKINLDF